MTTPRERVLATLSHQEPDRVPVAGGLDAPRRQRSRPPLIVSHNATPAAADEESRSCCTSSGAGVKRCC
jgi:hypothetical protein